MDLAGRVRELADAFANGGVAAFLSPRLRIEALGQAFGHEEAVALLAAAPPLQVRLRDVVVKRNVTFVDGEVAGLGAGLAVLSWDQDGRVVHATLQPRPPS